MTQQEKLVDIAKSLLGKPYKYGANSEEAPEVFDCSSFTQYIFKQIGIELPRSALLQAADPRGKEVEISNVKIGDLVFMRGIIGHYNDQLFHGRKFCIGHVAIYSGNNKIMHARSSVNSVVEQDIKEFTSIPNFNLEIMKRF